MTAPINIEYVYGVCEIDPYKLPPNVRFVNATSTDVRNFARSRKERKWFAAAIILGQPFNHKVVEPEK